MLLREKRDEKISTGHHLVETQKKFCTLYAILSGLVF